MISRSPCGRPHGTGDLDIVQASYTRHKANVTEALYMYTSLHLIHKYYHCGDKLQQILHTLLRTKCSSLNQHPLRRSLVGNPYCTCGEIENNKHFLLTFPRYNPMISEMILSIRQIMNVELTSDAFLFGTEAVTDEIFKAVQTYIKLSKRFSH